MGCDEHMDGLDAILFFFGGGGFRWGSLNILPLNAKTFTSYT